VEFDMGKEGPKVAAGEECAAGARDVPAMQFCHGGELSVKPREAS